MILKSNKLFTLKNIYLNYPAALVPYDYLILLNGLLVLHC